MTEQRKSRPRVKGMRSDTFKVIDGVRYIQDEEADMRQLRYHLRGRKERQARDEKYALILERCKGLLFRCHCDAFTIRNQCYLVGLDVEVKDVRNAMKSPEALHLFQRVRAPNGRIEWILRKDKE